MGSASRLVKAMQKAAKPKENHIVDIVVGTVSSISPLRIKVDKLELTQSFLILSALCVEKRVQITNSTEPYVSDILLWRGLQVNDKVDMIRCCEGQKYYVLQRKEGI